jgi:parallel beta-helix repeat protein
VVADCVAGPNANIGINVGGDGVVLRSAARENAVGITAANGAVIAHATVRDNAVVGIAAGAASAIQHCAAFGNSSAATASSAGISAGAGSVIAHCTVRNGLARGIIVGSNSLVLANNSSGHVAGDSAGIFTSGSNSRIEGNHSTGNSRGIVITAGTGNLVVRNTAAASTTTNGNYVIAAGNKVGAIVVPTNSGEINGNSGGGLGTTDPWVNFAY